MALSGESLNAVSVIGPGTELMFDEPRVVSSQITWAGTGNINIALEGTLDGVNWAIYRQFSSSVPGSYLLPNTDMPVMGVRANLTNIGGGGSVTVSVFLSASNF